MAHQIARPDLTGTSIEGGDWFADPQGVDYELIFDDEYHYCFMVTDVDPFVLSFMAHGLLSEDDLRGHPELHERKIPAEISERFVGETFVHHEDDSDAHQRFTITGIETTEIRGGDGQDDDLAEYEVTVFQTAGPAPLDELTAFTVVQGLAIETLEIEELEPSEADQ